ncbi:MAG: DUF2723 domain-containing protein [Bacteroides sp.]|nr:DUF2723 domain-containing protein [Bacteroides sp.]
MNDLHLKYNSRLNNIASWGVFLVAASIYLLTIDHSASFWDCPEYITCASRLEVGHPPGNPFWMLAMRFATMLFPSHLHALVVNVCSALCMAFAAFFLARIVFIFCIYVCSRHAAVAARRLDYVAACGSVTAGLSFAFCDSAWFSAVEAEVYAMSTFLTSLSVWLMLRWAMEESTDKRSRLLILVGYITGLSLGVHQLNLLCVPVYALIYVFRNYPNHATKQAWLAILISFAAVGFILLGIMPGTLACAARFELTAVNTFGLPYFSGVLIFAGLLCIFFPATAYFISHSKSLLTSAPALRSKLLTGTWITAFILLGYSSFAVILIRGYAAPPMNEAQPTDIFALSSYIARDQYGSKPLLYGATPYSKPMLQEKWAPGKPMPTYPLYALKNKGKIYAPYITDAHLHQRSGMMSEQDKEENARIIDSKNGYLISDYAFSRITTPELDMWFPRITGSSPYDLESYEDWTGMNKETMTKVKISEAFDTLGNPVGKMLNDGTREEKYSWRPTYLQNLNMLATYQIYYMYVRYLLWNFIGRQNDMHSTGEIEHGNFITGIPPIDNLMLGDQGLLPDYAGRNNPGRHVYFGIPFIMGISGICLLFRKGKRGLRAQAVVAMMFLMTGVAIVVYLNQTPGEARERDYSFLGSYMAFCVWIGMGLIWWLLWVAKAKVMSKDTTVARMAFAAVSAVSTLLVPAIMVTQNYGDHQRAGRSEPLDFASGILSIERPAIIFTYGDNHTFPLWYTQETEGIGQHHTVIDISYFTVPGYVVNIMKQGERGIPFTATPADINFHSYDFTRIAHDADTVPVPLIQALKELYSVKTGAPEFSHSNVFVANPNSTDTLKINLRSLAPGGLMSFRTLMLLDIVATNNELADPRPLLFLYPVKSDFYQAVKHKITPGVGGHLFDMAIPDSIRKVELTANFASLLKQLSNKDSKPYYRDPIIMDHCRRQRGSMIITACELLKDSDVYSATEAVNMIKTHYPYHEIPAGSFTVADTTFHEGIAYGRLLYELGRNTQDSQYGEMAKEHLKLIKSQAKGWERYYKSLSPRQRHTVSASTLRILSSLPQIDSLLTH